MRIVLRTMMEGNNGIDYIINIEKISFNDFLIDTASISYLTESESLLYLASNPDLMNYFWTKNISRNKSLL